jgi:hypothetical protein
MSQLGLTQRPRSRDSAGMKTRTTFALLAVAIATAGCGGGSGTTASSQNSPASNSPASSSVTSTAPHPPSVASEHLIASADQICQRLNTKLAASKPARQSIAELARVTPEHEALEQKAITELSKLTPPAAIALAWRKLVADRRTLANELLKLALDAQLKDVAGIRTLGVSKERAHKELLAVAKSAGFKACSRVG